MSTVRSTITIRLRACISITDTWTTTIITGTSGTNRRPSLLETSPTITTQTPFT
jgi:hypothetical protein